MKKSLLFLLALFCAGSFSFAQNTFPTPSGNVAIGTTVANELLSVGSPSLTPATRNPVIISQLSGGATIGGVYNTVETASPYGWGLAFDTYKTNVGKIESMRITNNGNVGIGTTTPQRTLDLSNAGQLTFGDDVVTNSTNGIYWFAGNHYGIYRTAGAWTGNTFQQLRIQFDTGIQLAPGPDVNTGYDKSYVEIVTGKGLMVSSGSVGIGTTNTNGYSLAVNGSAIATLIKVTANTGGPWPDYVFQPTYKLPTLKETEAYIVQNHHLSDMPSAADIAKDDINLGEMDKLLTKKVEELTLYLIDKDKQVNNLQKEVDDLKEQIKLLCQTLNKK